MTQMRLVTMLFNSASLRSSFSLFWTFCLALLVLAVPSTAQAQNSEPSRQEKLMHYSLYYENYKNENYKSARSDLLWVLKNAPGVPEGDSDNYSRAVKLYEGLAKQASSEKDREAYLDTAATYLATAPKKMEKKGIEFSRYEWEILQGRFVEKHQESLPKNTEGLKSPISHYRKAFELAPKKVNSYYIQQVLQSYLQENKLKKALSFAKEVEKKRGSDKKIMQTVSTVRNRIFGKNPQAQIGYLKQQLEQHPDSTQLLTKLFDLYRKQGNISKASDLAKRLMKKKPPAETIRQIAKMRLENGRSEAALEAYDRAVEQGAELKAEDYYNRGTAYQKLGELAEARAEYRKAIKMKEGFGRAYVAIGDLYANAVNQCSGSKMTRKDRAVYWAAVDKYQRAKRISSSVSSIADSKIQTYRQVFPTKEDIFYRNDWKKGASFTIDYGCYSWIGETTTVRPNPSSG